MRESERCSACNRSQNDYSVQWKCRFDFCNVIRLVLIAVGRGRRVWVEDCHRPNAEVRRRGRTAVKRSSAL